MRITVLTALTKADKLRWERQFVAPGHNYLESIWRRSQDAGQDSKTNKNNRRRIIHVIDRYDVTRSPHQLNKYELCIKECYLWLCSTLPTDELERYKERVITALAQGGWKKKSKSSWTKGELEFNLTVIDRHPEDINADRDYGADHQTIECTMFSKGMSKKRVRQESPWDVFNSGVRQPGTRVQDPIILEDMTKLIEYLPAQIELGGGASMELGIPPLNYLHTVYGLYTSTNDFAFGDHDTLLEHVLLDPVRFYAEEASLPYSRALTAQPNNFYRLLGELKEVGLIVGSVITNNFDGICSLMGLEELYVRRYDEAHIVPDIKFHPDAKSLIVIESHADRRRIQEAAKLQGLKVIYVDPESYINHGGNKISYPLEKIEADDILIPMTSSQFATKLEAALVSAKLLKH